MFRDQEEKRHDNIPLIAYCAHNNNMSAENSTRAHNAGAGDYLPIQHSVSIHWGQTRLDVGERNAYLLFGTETFHVPGSRRKEA